MAIKLDRVQRWLMVKRRLEQVQGIVVHFSGHHVNYYSAWQYAVKTDETPLHTADHPDLSDGMPPNTTHASRTRRDRRKRQVIGLKLVRSVYVKGHQNKPGWISWLMPTHRSWKGRQALPSLSTTVARKQCERPSQLRGRWEGHKKQ